MSDSKDTKEASAMGASEKENASSDQPTGVKFVYGFPGKEVQNKNRQDMPPRSTNNTPARGGASGGRGFSRGRGQNHNQDFQHGGRGRGKPNPGGRTPHYQNFGPPQASGKPPFKNNKYVKINHHNNNNNNSNVKNKNELTCGVCERPCTDVVCSSCGYHGKNLRVQKECIAHPRVIRVQDLKVCPECKTENIEEKPEVQKAREAKEAAAMAAEAAKDETAPKSAESTPVAISS